MDGIELEILWSNLIGIVSEQAKALQRIAFSPIVREAGDLASGLFDARGRMVAQANTGTPGHINSLAAAGEVLGRAISAGEALAIGDGMSWRRSVDVKFNAEDSLPLVLKMVRGLLAPAKTARGDNNGIEK